jgi:hypothetical protein
MSCDTSSFSLPADVERAAQDTANAAGKRIMIWRVFDSGPTALKPTTGNLSSIPVDGGGVISHGTMRWAIYNDDDALDIDPDFYQYIYTSSGTPISILSSATGSGSTKGQAKGIMKSCAKSILYPLSGARQNKGDRSREMTIRPLDSMRFTGIRASKALKRNNWYKQAQVAAKFDEKLLDDPKSLDKLTREQLMEAREYVKSNEKTNKDGWPENQKETVNKLINDFEFNKLPGMAVTKAELDRQANTGMIRFQQWITSVNANKDRMQRIINLYASDSPGSNPCEGVTSQRAIQFDSLVNSLSGIVKIVEMINLTISQTAYLDEAASQRASHSPERRRRDLDNACDSLQQFNAISASVGIMRNLLNAAVSDRFSEGYEEAQKILQLLAGRTENVNQTQITGLVAS